ncbi:MAG: hypothetical protein OJF50_001060 [Nitrospira sp.]|nr:hypothetical protein [Nitrospira sp.]
MRSRKGPWKKQFGYRLVLKHLKTLNGNGLAKMRFVSSTGSGGGPT